MFAEKLKILRKTLKLTQTAFGEKLGVSIDVIKNLEYNRTSPSEIFVNHLCEIYNVNRNWLQGTDENMFNQSVDEIALVERLLNQANASPSIRALLHSWLQLPPDKRVILEEFAEDFAARHSSKTDSE